MADELKYTAFQRSVLYDLAHRDGPHMVGALPLKLRDAPLGHEATGVAPFTLMAAAEIAGLKPGAIKHMAPPPGTRDAETTKFVHVDFYEPDLPWRYTPEAAFVPPQPPDPANKVVRPWLVLLVGTAAEVQVKGNIANVAAGVLAAHNLEESYLWAHMQQGRYNDEPAPVTISRILSPVALQAQREYVAVLVPAFNDKGERMWAANGAPNFGVLPAFHSWNFWTGEEGDFETLAEALHIPPAGDAGKARLHYRREVANIEEVLEVRGAITSLQEPQAPPAEVIAAIQGDVDILNDDIPGAIGLPDYGRPWLPDPDSIEAGWPDEINDDPRHRGLAGLGVWMGVEGQEALMDAAVKQAGALSEAGRTINHLALGLMAAGGLWERRLPADNSERLRVLGPMMGRLIAGGGGLVLDRVAGDSSPLPPALFSGAAQRLLRDRSAASRHVAGANGGLNHAEALAAANQPEPAPELSPDGIPHMHPIITERVGDASLEELLLRDPEWLVMVVEILAEIVRQVSDKYRSRRDRLLRDGHEGEIPAMRQDMAQNALLPRLNEELSRHLSDALLPCEAPMIISAAGKALGRVEFPEALEWVLEDEPVERSFVDFLYWELARCRMGSQCLDILPPHIEVDRQEFCDDLLVSFGLPPRPEQRGINLDGLAGALDTALDPRGPRAPALLRVCSRITGVDCTRLTRPEFPLRLDFPTWTLLRQYDREWLLPGASRLEKDSITALQTNPAFIDAFLVGLNSQFMSEMRWRDLAVDRTITPLRMFWGQVDYATGRRRADIEPLSEWAKDTAQPLGALAHQTIPPDDPANASGSRLVIVFHSALFRRYPATLVYLVKRPQRLPEESEGQYRDRVDALLKEKPALSMPPGDADPAAVLAWRRGRQFFGPILAAGITPDLTFFGFDVTPSKLDEYWLLLSEPPAELRFRNNTPRDLKNSATFAHSTLDEETRVAIDGDFLEQQALQNG